jgi:hypothetical protein
MAKPPCRFLLISRHDKWTIERVARQHARDLKQCRVLINARRFRRCPPPIGRPVRARRTSCCDMSCRAITVLFVGTTVAVRPARAAQPPSSIRTSRRTPVRRVIPRRPHQRACETVVERAGQAIGLGSRDPENAPKQPRLRTAVPLIRAREYDTSFSSTRYAPSRLQGRSADRRWQDILIDPAARAGHATALQDTGSGRDWLNQAGRRTRRPSSIAACPTMHR